MTLSHDRPFPEKKKRSHPCFFIENEGQAVAGTDYWQSVQAQAGYVYLSWNAGAARAACPGCGKTFTQGDAGGLSTSSSVREHCMAAMRWNWYLKTAAMRRL